MKTPRLLTTLAVLGSFTSAFAQLSIPDANGTDGPLNATATPIDLSQAIPGDALLSSNSGGNSGKGIYDAARWVIVFKYSSVNVPVGTTVTFLNHPSNAPVVWLVQGNVTIAGTVSVNGKNGVLGTLVNPADGGPGGFRGGATGPQGGGAGLGPGGAGGGGVGEFNSSYSSPEILPLIGGSGGSGSPSYSSSGGAGGAILIVSPGTIAFPGTVGSITALGGLRGDGNTNSGGSGGAIKLIAEQITGTGSLNTGLRGRVRIQANSLAASVTSTPATIAVSVGGVGATPVLFQALSSPRVRIVSVTYTRGTPPVQYVIPAPADPTAPLISAADLSVESNNPVTIAIETRDFTTGGATVAVRIANKYGGATSLPATLQSGGTSTLSTWLLSTTLPPGFTTLQVRATQP